MDLQQAKDAQKEALKNLETVGLYGKADKENNTSGISLIKVDNGDGTSQIAVGVVGSSGGLVEMLMRAMADSEQLRNTVQAAAAGYKMFGSFLEAENGEDCDDTPCSCPECKEAIPDDHKQKSEN